MVNRCVKQSERKDDKDEQVSYRVNRPSVRKHRWLPVWSPPTRRRSQDPPETLGNLDVRQHRLRHDSVPDLAKAWVAHIAHQEPTGHEVAYRCLRNDPTTTVPSTLCNRRC